MLSICIVNWNTKAYLRECLASLEAYPPDDEGTEIIVVDNASSDGSAQMVRDEFPDVVLITQTKNVGYADANNVALRRTIGDILLLLNPDVRINPDTLANALSFLRSHPKSAAVSILFRNPNGSLQRSLRGFPSPESLLWEIIGVARLMPKSRRFAAYFMRWFGYDHAIEVDQPMGTFLMIPRAAYESVGELDSEFPIFFNEVDWCFRAKNLGWKIWFTPNAEIIHYGGQGTRQAPKAAMVRESHISLLRFYEKHYSQSINPLIYTLIRSAIMMSCALQSLRARQ